ncbi:MAG: hypothetical protein ACK5PF_06610, partial [bacterium]
GIKPIARARRLWESGEGKSAGRPWEGERGVSMGRFAPWPAFRRADRECWRVAARASRPESVRLTP